MTDPLDYERPQTRRMARWKWVVIVVVALITGLLAGIVLVGKLGGFDDHTPAGYSVY